MRPGIGPGPIATRPMTHYPDQSRHLDLQPDETPTPGAIRDWLRSSGVDAEFAETDEFGTVAVFRHCGLDAVRIGPSGTDDHIPSADTMLVDLATTLDVPRRLLATAIRKDWSLARLSLQCGRLEHAKPREVAGE